MSGLITSNTIYQKDFLINVCALLVVETHLKGEKGHDNGHPADCHGDVSSPLLGDDVNGAEEEHGPDDVVEDNKAQEGHQDPQWDTHHLQPAQTHTQVSLKEMKGRTLSPTVAFNFNTCLKNNTDHIPHCESIMNILYKMWN